MNQISSLAEVLPPLKISINRAPQDQKGSLISVSKELCGNKNCYRENQKTGFIGTDGREFATTALAAQPLLKY